MKPLRIMHAEAATGFGGQEHRIFKEMRAMRDRGHYLEAICQPHAMLVTRLRAEGFTVHEVAMAGTANFYKGILKRSEEHTSELQSRPHLVCRLLLEKKKKK